MKDDTSDEIVYEDAENTIKNDPKASAELSRLLGVAQANDMQKQFGDAVLAMSYKHIKESRLYKLKGMDWKTFCSVELKKSQPTVDEMIANLNTFGQSFLESAESLGISRSMFRQFRGLPAPELDNVRALVESGQAEAVKEFYEEKLADKEQEVRALNKEAEQVRTEKLKAIDKVEKLQTDLDKSRKVIEDFNYTRTQLRNDTQAFLAFLNKIDNGIEGALTLIDDVALKTLDAGHIRSILAILQRGKEIISLKMRAIENAYPGSIALDEGEMAERADFTPGDYSNIESFQKEDNR